MNTCYPQKNTQTHHHFDTDDTHQAISFLLNTDHALSEQHDLSPNNPTVNQLLSVLVNQLSRWSQQSELQHLASHKALKKIASTLPKYCGTAECEMEKWWLKKLLSTTTPISESLNEFWYIQQYTELVNTELGLLDQIQPSKIAFLGCGSLPLTALMIAKEVPGSQIRCIDYDQEACSGADELIKRCGLQQQIEVINISASQFVAEPNELIICASLLRAPQIYHNLYEQQVEHILVRDAEGVFRFLYEAASLPANTLYQEIAKSECSEQRINTSRLFKRASLK